MASSLLYPAQALAGTGRIGGRRVACISPQWLVRFHTGYAAGADDRRSRRVSRRVRTARPPGHDTIMPARRPHTA
ncbi:nucleotidyltransferase domain-containing protein [Planobispora rosea]|uniref:nucleotidyltransferase domain-containing protein n=1 Tax=Planobispora rosea TaxID=35762 RepID=UPI003CC80E50